MQASGAALGVKLNALPALRRDISARNAFATSKRPIVQRRRVSLKATAEAGEDASKYEDGVRCYMTKDGALVCERLPAGNYRLEAAAPRERDEAEALKDAPRCDPTRPNECLTYCYVMEDGSMVCEGLPAGEYEIRTAGAEDVERMVQHAIALEKGATYKDVVAASAPPEKKEESFIGKITSFLRGT